MATYTIAVTGTSTNTIAISSTAVKVTANVACYYAINQDASFQSNANIAANVGAMIAANRPTTVNMQGLNNKLALIAVGASGQASVTEVGTVYSSSMNQNNTTFLNP